MMRKIILFLSVFAVTVISMDLVMAEVCEANNNCYYVAPNGSDSNNGSFEYSWQTVEKAFTNVEPGDTVYFREGTYEINTTIETKYNINPNSSSPVKFSNYNNESVTLTSSVNRAIYVDRDYYEVEGFTFSAPGTFWYVAKTYNATHFKISNCNGTITVEGGGENLGCVRFQSNRANNGRVENCIFQGPGSGLNDNTAGVFVFRTQGLKILNCEFSDIPRSIFYKHTCIASDTGIELGYNYFHDCGSGIVTVSQYSDIHDNLFVNSGLLLGTDGGTGDDGLNAGSDHNLIHHNTFYNGTIDLVQSDSNDGSGAQYNIIKDNVFTNITNIFQYEDPAINPHYTAMDYNLYKTGNAVRENATYFDLEAWQTHNIHDYNIGVRDNNSLSDTPLFVGGASPLSISDFALVNGSIGKNAASDGSDMGADIDLVGVQSRPMIFSLNTSFLDHGDSIAITGSGFGTKATVAPILWDNFEWGSDGDGITTSTENSYAADGNREAEIDTSKSYGQGTRSVYNEAFQSSDANEANEFRPFYYYFPGQTEAYLSVMARFSADGIPTGMWKSPRLIGGNGVYSRGPGLSWTGFYNSGTYYDYYYDNSGNFIGAYGTPSVYKSSDRDSWIRLEFYVAASTPGISDGKALFWVNSIADNRAWDSVMTRDTGMTNRVTTFNSGHMFVNGVVDQKHYLWIDDLYIDNTLQRIELCNGSTWASRSHCEIQIPQAWSDDSITINVNQGSFSNGEVAYLFVVDANGKPSEGYPITLGEVGHRADLNEDNLIDMPELIAFIARWKAGDGVTKTEVEGARDIWFSGGIYTPS